MTPVPPELLDREQAKEISSRFAFPAERETCEEVIFAALQERRLVNSQFLRYELIDLLRFFDPSARVIFQLAQGLHAKAVLVGELRMALDR